MIRALVVAVFAFAAAAQPATAHDARPLAINLVEQSTDVWRATVQQPPTLGALDAPSIRWPQSCAAPDGAVAGGSATARLLSCPGGLEGGEIAIDYPGVNPSLTTLIRVERADGSSVTAVLPPDQSVWTVPTEPDWRTVARDYVVLGFAHIWEGPDHLMFVAGLLLLAQRPKRILLAVTGFTAAHSITLTLATLDLVRVPIPPVEAMIALSILFLAGELARSGPESFSRRFPIALSFAFGLLHGFGFASALGEIGLPTRDLAVGLVCFNLGVELGQLAFVAAAGLVVLVWRGVRSGPASALRPPLERHAGLIGAYVLGVPAALWFLERSASALGL